MVFGDYIGIIFPHSLQRTSKVTLNPKPLVEVREADGPNKIRSSRLYVTLEPCIMCAA